jgi:hypothetical protein
MWVLLVTAVRPHLQQQQQQRQTQLQQTPWKQQQKVNKVGQM